MENMQSGEAMLSYIALSRRRSNEGDTTSQIHHLIMLEGRRHVPYSLCDEYITSPHRLNTIKGIFEARGNGVK